MPTKTIRLRVVTNEGKALEDEAVAVRAPGERGFVGFLCNHAPLVTTIRPGPFTWRRPSGERREVLIGEGLLEIAHNTLTLLTRSVAEAPAAKEARTL